MVAIANMIFSQDDKHFMVATVKNFFKKENFYKAFSFVFVVYLLGYLALFRANVDYIDDLRRSVDGNPGWSHFSRYTSTFLSKFFNFSSHITDISPLSQMIALFFVSLASLVLVHVFAKKVSYLPLFVSTGIGLSPFYLQCMSYKFDAPYMGLSLLASITPFLFAENKKVFFLVSMIALTLMYTTYQAGNGLFIVVAIFYVLKDYLDGINLKSIVTKVLLFASSFVVATLIYKVFLIREIDIYITSHTFPLNKMLSGTLDNISSYFGVLYHSVADTILLKVFVVLHILFLLNTSLANRNIDYRKTFIISILALATALALSFGLYSVLERIIFTPRSFYGMTGYMTILLLFIVTYKSHSSKLQKFANVLTVLFICNLLAISTSYGNALKAQQDYSDFRIAMMLSDLNRMSNGETDLTIHTNGRIGWSPVTESIKTAFPIMDKLVFQTARENWDWTSNQNYQYFMNLKIKKCDKSNPPLDSLNTAGTVCS